MYQGQGVVFQHMPAFPEAGIGLWYLILSASSQWLVVSTQANQIIQHTTYLIPTIRHYLEII